MNKTIKAIQKAQKIKDGRKYPERVREWAKAVKEMLIK